MVSVLLFIKNTFTYFKWDLNIIIQQVKLRINKFLQLLIKNDFFCDFYVEFLLFKEKLMEILHWKSKFSALNTNDNTRNKRSHRCHPTSKRTNIVYLYCHCDMLWAGCFVFTKITKMDEENNKEILLDVVSIVYQLIILNFIFYFTNILWLLIPYEQFSSSSEHNKTARQSNTNRCWSSNVIDLAT